MKFPVGWIKEFVNVKLSDSELASLLTSIGFTVDSIEKIEGENVFEIDITTNRPDCMNIIGLAREIAAATNRKLKLRKERYREVKPASRSIFKVEILNPSLCWRYSGRVIKNVKISPSPFSIAKRIIQSGLRPINCIVDASNYVLLELGHPIHIFDLSRLKGNRIVVRNARNGEKIVTIDAAERELTEDMLVIADESDPVAIAGIMGGLHSEVTDSTRNIFIESAYFDPRSVRLTSKKLGLSTDASYRFERGADFHATLKAIDRVTSLIMDCSGGDVQLGYIDVIKKRSLKKQITVRMESVEKILGVQVKDEAAVRILRSLEMKTARKSKRTFKVIPPSFRIDTMREIDLIEDIARFVGYDSLPRTIPYSTEQNIKSKSDVREELLKEMLIPAGYSEAINYSMISDEEDALYSFYDEAKPLKIDNPLSENVATLRRSLLPGLFRNISSNISRGSKDIKLFEAGKIYYFSRSKQPEEKKHVALMATGSSTQDHWSHEKRETEFWDIKGAAEAILKRLNCNFLFKEVNAKHVEGKLYDRSFSFEFISEDGKRLALGGRIDPVLAQKYKIFQPIWAVELSLNEIPDPSLKVNRFRAISQLPIIKRDLSIIVDESVRYSEIEKLLAEKWCDSSIEIGLKNRYFGKSIPEGRVSLTFGITIHQKDRTLTSDEINKITEKILDILSRGIDAELRKE
ncbi:MAG: phenylalanine--tRNA ligase subunit beta [Acidobacteriota bacterium]